MTVANTIAFSCGAWSLSALAAGVVVAHADPADKEDDKNHPVTVDFGSMVSPCPVSELPPLSVVLTPTADAATLVVRVEAVGLFALATPGYANTASRPTTQPTMERRFRKVVKGDAHRMEWSLVCLPHRRTGRVVLHVEARDARDQIINQLEVALHGYAVRGQLYYGLQSPVALRQAHILDLERDGLITPKESLRRRQELTARRQGASQPPTPTDAEPSKPEEVDDGPRADTDPHDDANRDAGRQPDSRNE
ncbi:MAG: hypothetical protein IID40_04510 [Planctomycetes bacterium]|nr:hypothetical protein [Planctomycetota bacterium]